MKVKVTKTIPVGCHTYSIFFDKKMADSNDWGMVNYRTLQILINPFRPDSQKLTSLVHEYIHIVSNIYTNKVLDDENVIDGLCEGLSQIIVAMGIELDWSDIEEINENQDSR